MTHPNTERNFSKTANMWNFNPLNADLFTWSCFWHLFSALGSKIFIFFVALTVLVFYCCNSSSSYLLCFLYFFLFLFIWQSTLISCFKKWKRNKVLSLVLVILLFLLRDRNHLIVKTTKQEICSIREFLNWWNYPVKPKCEV